MITRIVLRSGCGNVAFLLSRIDPVCLCHIKEIVYCGKLVSIGWSKASYCERETDTGMRGLTGLRWRRRLIMRLLDLRRRDTAKNRLAYLIKDYAEIGAAVIVFPQSIPNVPTQGKNIFRPLFVICNTRKGSGKLCSTFEKFRHREPFV